MVKKRRILVVATFPPPIHGSAIVSQYIKDSTKINEAFDCDYVNLSTSRKMDEIGKNSPVKMIRVLIALIKEFWLLLTHRYNLCYLAITCHGKGFLKDVPFALMCKIFGGEIVIHQHNKGMSRDVGSWPYKLLIPLVYKNAKVILLSQRLYPDISSVVSVKNVIICPNGIDGRVMKRAQCSKSEPRLLFVSNLMRSKGVYELLDSIKLLKERGYKFVCDIVGGETSEISERQLQSETEKRNIKDVTIYHGEKYGIEKERLFVTADIFIHPTLDDCFPLVLLEAMKYGLPIVTTNQGGIPDMIEDSINGFVCESKDSETIAKRIQMLIDDLELRGKMGNNSLEKFKTQYTNNMFESNMYKIFDSLT